MVMDISFCGAGRYNNFKLNNMQIDDNFYIKKDTVFSFSLIKKSKKTDSVLTKNPDELKETITYHSSIENCLRSYVKQTVNGSNSITDVLDKLKYLDKKIEELGIKFKDEDKA